MAENTVSHRSFFLSFSFSLSAFYFGTGQAPPVVSHIILTIFYAGSAVLWYLEDKKPFVETVTPILPPSPPPSPPTPSAFSLPLGRVWLLLPPPPTAFYVWRGSVPPRWGRGQATSNAAPRENHGRKWIKMNAIVSVCAWTLWFLL